MQKCRSFRSTATAERHIDLDPDLPEEFKGLEKVETESEADVKGLEAPPTVVARVVDVSLFFVRGEKVPRKGANF